MPHRIENQREPRINVEKDPVRNVLYLSQLDNTMKLTKTGTENLIKVLQTELKRWGID